MNDEPALSTTLDRVNYDVLDRVKLACIAASKRTLGFAADYGEVVDANLGASANLFAFRPVADGRPLICSLIAEGLGTADDARPEDLTEAELTLFWRNIAFKALATMTNDAASSGLRPLLVSLYLPSNNPDEVFTEAFLTGFLNGFVDACARVGCVYISGETPQLKSKIYPGVVDIAGSVFAFVPEGSAGLLPRGVAAGDQIVLVESSGPHENGFTSLRSLPPRLAQGYRTKLPGGTQYWQAINQPSILYSPLVQRLLKGGLRPSAVENITGHGWQKLMRSRQALDYRIHTVLPMPEIFPFVAEQSGMTWREMFATFNCGAGLAIYCPDEGSARQAVSFAAEEGLTAVLAGTVEAADTRRVTIEPFGVTLGGSEFSLSR